MLQLTKDTIHWIIQVTFVNLANLIIVPRNHCGHIKYEQHYGTQIERFYQIITVYISVKYSSSLTS